jgi:hypothetical protein
MTAEHFYSIKQSPLPSNRAWGYSRKSQGCPRLSFFERSNAHAFFHEKYWDVNISGIVLIHRALSCCLLAVLGL